MDERDDRPRQLNADSTRQRAACAAEATRGGRAEARGRAEKQGVLVAEAAKAGAARVSATRRNGVLVVDVDAEAEHEGLIDLEDRVGSLEGRLAVERAPGGRVRIRAEIPCG